MYVKAECLAKIRQHAVDTYYMYCREEKMILPLDVGISPGIVPDSADSIRRIVAMFGSRISCVKIYREHDDNFYSYVGIHKSNTYYDINVALVDALRLQDSTKCPVYINKGVLMKSGIKVTKNLIQEALENGE